MLRTLDEHGGIKVYSKNLVDELLRIDQENEYVFFYRSPDQKGTYADFPNVKEVVLGESNKIIWDQVLLPRAAKREAVDVIFNPKFTVPFFTSIKSVMTLHGADWFIPEHAQYYNPFDVRYIRLVMPLYCRKATRIISISELTTYHFNRILGLPQGKIKTTYFGPARFFRRETDESKLHAVRKKYNLPEHFIFSLTKYGMGGGNRKNIDKIFLAYEKYFQQQDDPLPLVIAGKDCEQYRDDYNIPDTGYGAAIRFPGFVDQTDLPAIYSAARFYLYPSNVEAFPIPLTEAMTCGTPIITSNVNGLKEIAGEAALFVDPGSVEDIADAMCRLDNDPELRDSLSRAGLERSRIFSWEKCARETLELLEHV
jgi:glycosyltransferase involved in cell wall biosynthesis